MDPGNKSLEDKFKSYLLDDMRADDNYETDLKIYRAFERELELEPEFEDDGLGEIEWW
jgi:hypothetical protein